MKLFVPAHVPPCLRESVADLDRVVSQLKRITAGSFTTDEKLDEALSLLMQADAVTLHGRKALRKALQTSVELAA